MDQFDPFLQMDIYSSKMVCSLLEVLVVLYYFLRKRCHCSYWILAAIEKVLDDGRAVVKEMYPMLFSGQLTVVEIEKELIVLQVVKGSAPEIPDQEFFSRCYYCCFVTVEAIEKALGDDQVEVKERYPMLFLDQLKQSVAEIERVLLHVPDYSSTLACSLPEVLVVLRVVMELFDYQ